MLARPACSLMLCTALAMACSSTDATSDDDALDTESTDTTGASTDELDTTSTTDTPEPDSSSDDPTDTPPPECTSDDHCDDATPFCGPGGICQASCSGVLNPGASCEGKDPTTPLCIDGECVECTAGNTSACDDGQPICSPTNECMACTEHHHCPDTACHLDGPRAGQCFEEFSSVATAQTLSEVIANLPYSGRMAIHLFPGDYELESSLAISDNQEVAIIGTGNLIKSNLGYPVSVTGEGILYLSDVIIRDDTPSWPGLYCTGESVWVDDSLIRNNSYGIEARFGCHVHLRRSSLRNNEHIGIFMHHGLFRCENSLIARNGSYPNGNGGIVALNTQLDITFCTVAENYSASTINDHSISCAQSSGLVRNSIVTAYGESVYLENCDNMIFETNAVDTSNLGASNTQVGNVSTSWFVNPQNGNYRLTQAGVDAIGDIAIWQEGDPETDIDGTSRDTRGTSFPGYHEPSP